MKKLVLVTMLVVGMVSGLWAETNSVVTNPIPAMVENAFLSLKTKEATGWGAQIAYAMKGTISALTDGMTVTTDQIYKFSESGLGKITIGVIVYNIIGKEIIRLILGIGLFIFLCCGIKKWFRFYLSYTVDEDGDKKGVFLDLYNDSPESAIGAISILVGSFIASFFCVLFVLDWIF